MCVGNLQYGGKFLTHLQYEDATVTVVLLLRNTLRVGTNQRQWSTHSQSESMRERTVTWYHLKQYLVYSHLPAFLIPSLFLLLGLSQDVTQNVLWAR